MLPEIKTTSYNNKSTEKSILKQKKYYKNPQQLKECQIHTGCIWSLCCECENCKKNESMK